MSDKIVIHTLRAMAWARAKGELQAVLQTYTPKYENNEWKKHPGFDDARKMINNFIEDFES